MAQQIAALAVQPRAVLGKKTKGLRRQGITPLHLYGPGVPSQALQAPSATLRKVLLRVGKSRPVSLQIEGGATTQLAFVREVQFHPLTTEVLHADFYRVDITRKMQAEVPVRLVGEAPAVRSLGGILGQVLHAVTVECLPLEVPEEFRMDISSLDTFDKALRVADLKAPPGVEILDDPEQVVVHVSPPRMEEVKEEVAAEVQPTEVEEAAKKAPEAGGEAGKES